MPPRRVRALLIVFGVFFVALATAATLIGSLPADATVREHVLGQASPAVVAAMRIANLAGDWRVLLPGTLALLALVPRARARWWIWCVLMVTAPAAEGLLKIVVRRARPEDPSFGFPSGHATAAAAFFGAVLYLAGALPPWPRRVARVAAVVGVILVGLARVILRAHWPSDVLGGIALGFGLAAVAAMIDDRRAGLSGRSPRSHPGRPRGRVT